ncbi:MFS transporter [Saccharopolyspora dendranthemae]|uniref:Fucose permease n=1 Tax=Saccharopolyspora dendranthemae TaxID=1181886 RepID=A0A561V8V2_9PSEU|nr:MFS transporter [Saccharopolyspora dendranthemae]TWG08035.1 fucose permease [Saccharopolyspora dendranthemae]
MAVETRADSGVLRARNAVAVVFAANGFAMASWMSRIPEARDALSVTPGELGRLLLAISIGSILALPLAGALVHRFGARAVITGAAALDAFGVALAGTGAGVWGDAWVTAAGLFAFGLGTGVWDVAMNIDGAAVERRIGRTIMPRFHAGFSLGTVIGAGVGAACAGLGVPVVVHLIGAAVLVAVIPAFAAPFLLPAHEDEGQHESSPGGGLLRAWAEPRTLLIGLMVLALGLTEGTANDWLAVALVDGHDIPPWLGAVGFAVFLSAMTTGRVVGTVLLDRFGRTKVLWATMATAAVGVLLVVYGTWLPLVFFGAVVWGIGASLGFPVGMSAAADDPTRAAARVSVVSTVGYTAFLAGPPLLGYLADHVGTLHALLLVAVLLVPSALAVPAAAPPRNDPA